MKRLLALLLVIIPAISFAAELPALTGRVVDNANILSPQTKAQLTANLEAHEKQTTNQVVVVTVPSLNNQPIEDFGVKLGRAWGIGQKGKNNGVLFVIAPNDRQVRIEVGYGLEGTLTDALSSKIIQSIVLPQFRAGNIEGGVVDGTTAIISVLGGKVVNFPAQQPQEDVPSWVIILILIIIIIFRIYGGFWVGGSGFSMGSGGFGRGFSGGGGSFGGGGSSGRW